MSDELVERVENSVIAIIKRMTGCPQGACSRPGGCGGASCDEAALLAFHIARAALAIIEPAVRQECIAIASRWSRDGQSATAHGIIEGIREGAKP